jgi:hypothetical protein
MDMNVELSRIRSNAMKTNTPFYYLTSTFREGFSNMGGLNSEVWL